jgi:hypothetical protein
VPRESFAQRHASGTHHATEGITVTMTMNSTASRAGNGKKVSVQERPRGIVRAQEDEYYHMTALIRDCLREADITVSKVHSKASERFTDFHGEDGTEPLDFCELGAQLLEARECLVLALQHLDDLRFGGYSRVLNGPWEVISVFPSK